MSSETYNELTLVDLQNNLFTINNVFRDMKVDRFKRAVGIKARLPQASWDSLRLHLGDTEMDDTRTLESYNLDDDSRIHFVSSSPQSRQRQQPQAVEATLPPTYATTPVLIRAKFDNVFVRSTNDGKTFTFTHVPKDESVKDFRDRVADRLGWSRDDAHYIRLIYVKQLEDRNCVTSTT